MEREIVRNSKRFWGVFVVAALGMLFFAACSSEKNAVNNQPAAAPAAQENQAPAAQETNKADAAKADAAKADAAPAEAETKPAERNEADFARLLNPADFKETAPDNFVVLVKTTKGDLKIELHRDWSPNGVDRFYNLVKGGFFSDIAFFRMVRGFVVQFGIHGSPLVSEAWRDANISDDPVKETNARGTLVFATAGPNTRTTQLFINLNDNRNLDRMGFSPIGKVVEGMDIIDSLNYEYAERPNQGAIQRDGNTYLKAQFPNLDYIESMTVE